MVGRKRSKGSLKKANMSHLLLVWQKLPPSIRRNFHIWLQSMRRFILPLQVSHVWHKGQTAAINSPVVILGLLRSNTGIGQGARLYLRALNACRNIVYAVDVDQILRDKVKLASIGLGFTSNQSGVVLSHLNPPELELFLQRSGALMLKGRRHIGYWAWGTAARPNHMEKRPALRR